jgi:peroxiredoxin
MTDIAEQVSEFNTGFNEQVGPRLAAVFAAEQEALRAAGVPDGVVAVGSTLPDAELIATDGSTVGLYDSIGDAPAVVVFYRGAWCPYCNIALKHYQQTLLPELTARGVRLLAISPQTPDGSTATVGNGALEFTVLSDPANVLVRSLGILTEPSSDARAAHRDLGFDVADSNADGTGDIPFPTVLVIDENRVVTFADVHVDYTTRTEVPAIVGAVDALTVATAG